MSGKDVRPRAKKGGIISFQFMMLTISSFFFFIGIRMMPVFLPLFIEQNLGGSIADVGILYGLTPLVAIVARMPMGKHIDRKGRKGILIFGAMIYVLMPLLFSVAPDTTYFGLFRIIQGCGIAAFTVASLAMAIDLAPKDRVGEAVGLFSGANILAMAVGPLIAGGLVQTLGPIGTFYVISSISTVALCFCFFIPERFTPREIESTSYRDVVKDNNLVSASVTSFFLLFTYNAVVVFISLYMVSLSLGPVEIGAFFSVYAMATIISRPFAGRLSDRIGRRKVVLPMMIIGAVAIALLALAGDTLAFIVLAFLYGIGYGSSFAPLSAMAVDTINPASKGAALSIYYGFYDLGLGLGAATMGFIALGYGFETMFGVNAAILFIGILVFAVMTGGTVWIRKGQRGGARST